MLPDKMKYVLLLSIGMLLASGAAAQSATQSRYFLYGRVYNAITRQDLSSVRVYLERPDGTVLDSSMTYQNHQVGTLDNIYSISIPKKGGHYCLRFEMEGYETARVAVDSIPFKGRGNYRRVKDVLLHRRAKEQRLGEATVTATKVKIYTKGDTLVYNADAFQLAEGSMLDALIKQLPGAELKDDGRILVNGKQVESLLLNGEDFFRGNNTVMLDNLPAYMVKDVQVYDKDGKLSEFAGRNMDDRTYVMDVRLKKQYSIGWIANAEGGYGSKDRYLGRLFALRFTPQSRVSLFGNMNNLNDNRKPGQDNEWTPEKMPKGLVATKMGGLDYLVKDRLKRYEVSGNATVNYTGGDYYTATSGETFLPEGNTWKRSESKQRTGNFSLNTSHTFEYKWENMKEFSFGPSFSYSRWDNEGSSLAATFGEDPSLSISEGLLDSIRRPSVGPLLRRMALNRYLAQSRGEGHTTSAGLWVNGMWKPNSSDVISLYGQANWRDSRSENFSHTLYDYPATAGQTPSDFRNQHTLGHPDHNLNYRLTLNYYFWFPINLCITPRYTIGQSRTEDDYALERLDRLDGWGEGTEHGLGVLPSEVDYTLRTLDLQNSYQMEEVETWHQPALYAKWEGEGRHKTGYWRIYLNLPVRFTHRRLDYARAAYDGISRRNNVSFQPTFTLERYWNNWNSSLEFEYNLNNTLPDMTSFLGIEDTSDPLNISTGNADLKSTNTHNLNFRLKHNISAKQRFFNMGAFARLRQNAVAQGYTYDRATGARRYRPENVNGNYMLYGYANYNMPLDRPHRLTLSTNTYAEFSHSVDLISTDDATPRRSTGKIFWATETLRLDYRIGKFRVGAKGYVGWNNVRSSREDFSTQNVFDINYGPTLQVELPWDIQLSTDLTMYSRRGYSDPAANTNDLVWNARLSKHVPKANLTFLIDGFDILHNLSNLTQTMNSQGRTETYRNVLPRYVMVHVIYRLNIKPRKLPGE